MTRMEELSLKVLWGLIAAKAWVSSKNSPVLCILGILDNAGVFDRLISLLPKTLYYVSIDLPGHGFSSHFRPGLPIQFFYYILTLRYVIEELGWKTFHCIGHSLGEGITPLPISNEEIIPRVQKIHNAVYKLQSHDELKDRLYTRESSRESISSRVNPYLHG